MGQAFLFLFVSIATSGLLVILLKIVIGRARPRMAGQFGDLYFAPFSFDSDFASFPSGHANTVFAVAIALAFLPPRLRRILLCAACFIALTRVIGRAHYLSDTVAGAALAVATTRLWRSVFLARGILFHATLRGVLLDPKPLRVARLRHRIFRLPRISALGRGGSAPHGMASISSPR